MEGLVEREFRSVPHEGMLYSRPVMSTNIRTAVLERNKMLRDNPGTQRDLTFGRQVMSIPRLDWYHLQKKYPDLASNDPHTADVARRKFMATSEAAPYLLR